MREPLLISGTVCGSDGKPLPDAVVDIWHSDSDGYYDVQQLEKIGDLAMRGRFRTDAYGRFHCWSIKPAAYPIPHDGPVGQMLDAQGRHPWRPAHVHFMISAARHEKRYPHLCVGRSISGFGCRVRSEGQPDRHLRREAARQSE
jgi:hydroxyquinol 1,2-dioxygenase